MTVVAHDNSPTSEPERFAIVLGMALVLAVHAGLTFVIYA